MLIKRFISMKRLLVIGVVSIAVVLLGLTLFSLPKAWSQNTPGLMQGEKRVDHIGEKKSAIEVRAYLQKLKARIDAGEELDPIKNWLQSERDTADKYSIPKRFGYTLHLIQNAVKKDFAKGRIRDAQAIDFTEFAKLAKQLRDSNRDMEARFVQTEQKCIDAGLPQMILDRHRSMVITHREKTGALLEALDQLKDSLEKGDVSGQTAAAGQLEILLEDVQVVKEPVPLSNELPHGFQYSEAPTVFEDDIKIPLTDADIVSDSSSSQNEQDSNPILGDDSIILLAVTGLPDAVDLDPTIDIQLTQEIMDLAANLDNDPLKIYRYVRNNLEFEPYAGSRKGSLETLNQGRGNDYDLCSLLIALLRASGIPARYVIGTVEMPADQVKKWLGVDDGATAGSILATVGMEGINIIDSEGQVISVRFKHVWVEAYFAYTNYRGIRADDTGKMWVPMDPAVKQYIYQEGIDIPSEMGFDAKAFIDEYIATYHEPSPVELFTQEIEDYLMTNYPEIELEDVLRTRSIINESIGFIPGSLPFTVRSVENDYASIPANMRYTMRFHLYDGSTTFIEHSVNLPEIAGKQVTISYEPATAADQAVIDVYGGMYETPPYLVSLRPVLKIDGETVATGTAAIGMGMTHSSDMHFTPPTGASNQLPTVSNSITAGTYQAIGISTGGVINPNVFIPAGDETTPDVDGFTGEKLWRTAMGYLDRVQRSEDGAACFLQMVLTGDVSEAIVENAVLVTYSYGTPQTFEWRGLVVDADRKISGPFSVKGDTAKPKSFMILSGADGSISENRIFEDEYGEEAVSTIKILELSSDLGIPIYTFTNDNIDTLYSALNLSATNENSLYYAVSIGHEVTVPRDNITYGQWYGTGYIDMEPDTGAAGYIISGGQSGGATVDMWTSLKMFIFTIFRNISSVTAVITRPATNGQFFPVASPLLCNCPDRLYFEVDYTINYEDGSSREVHETYTPHSAYPLGNYIFHAGYNSGATRSYSIEEVSASGVPDKICVDQEKIFSIDTTPDSPTIGAPTFSSQKGRLTVSGSTNPFTMKGVSGHADPDTLTAEYECCWGETQHEVQVLPEHVVGIPGLGVTATRYREHDFLISNCPDCSQQDTTLDFEIDGCSNSPDSFESNVIEARYLTNFDLYVSEPVWGSVVGNVANGEASLQSLPCNLHDICYQTCGRSQASCDSELQSNMEDVCSNSYPRVIPATIPSTRWAEYMDERLDCMDAAAFYHSVLSGAGSLAWTLRQNQHCYCCKGN